MHEVARVTEITARSETSFEDAIQTAISRASQTLRNVSGAWVKEQKLAIEDGQITAYQVDLLVTFVLDDTQEVNGAGMSASATRGSASTSYTNQPAQPVPEGVAR